MSLLHFAWDSLNHLIGRLIHDNGGVMSGASVVASHQQPSNAPRPCGVLQAHSTHGEASIRNRFSRRSPIAMLARPHWATPSTAAAALGFVTSLSEARQKIC